MSRPPWHICWLRLPVLLGTGRTYCEHSSLHQEAGSSNLYSNIGSVHAVKTVKLCQQPRQLRSMRRLIEHGVTPAFPQDQNKPSSLLHMCRRTIYRHLVWHWLGLSHCCCMVRGIYWLIRNKHHTVLLYIYGYCAAEKSLAPVKLLWWMIEVL